MYFFPSIFLLFRGALTHFSVGVRSPLQTCTRDLLRQKHSEIVHRASRFRNQSDSSIRTSKYLNKPIKLSRVQPLLRVKSISRRLECLSKTSNLFRNFFRRSAKTKQTHHNHRVFVFFFVHLLLTLLSRVSFVLFSFHLYFCIVLTKV